MYFNYKSPPNNAKLWWVFITASKGPPDKNCFYSWLRIIFDKNEIKAFIPGGSLNPALVSSIGTTSD